MKPKIRKFRKEKIPPPHTQNAFVYPNLPLDLEIGCGTGIFAINYARMNPGRFFVAIERTKTRFSRFLTHLKQHPPLANLMPVRDNAINWISHNMKPETVDRYFLFYPNPYPKKAQRNKRWPVMPFMEFLIETMKPKAQIILTANRLSYIEEARDWMENYWKLVLLDYKEIKNPPSYRAQTQFEIKYLERGNTCYELVFEKTHNKRNN